MVWQPEFDQDVAPPPVVEDRDDEKNGVVNATPTPKPSVFEAAAGDLDPQPVPKNPYEFKEARSGSPEVRTAVSGTRKEATRLLTPQPEQKSVAVPPEAQPNPVAVPVAEHLANSIDGQKARY